MHPKGKLTREGRREKEERREGKEGNSRRVEEGVEEERIGESAIKAKITFTSSISGGIKTLVTKNTRGRCAFTDIGITIRDRVTF
jgi:hypothetical protein